MDPFKEVFQDAQEQLTQLEQLLAQYKGNPSNNNLADVNNSIQELTETIHDLSQSIGAVQSKPSDFGVTEFEIDDRITKVAQLNNRLADIQQSISQTKATLATSSGILNESAPDAADQPAGQMSDLMYQDTIQEQDTVLDSVYTTVNSLREQANVMSRELEDQSYLIEDFDRQVDTAGDRLRKGLKKIDWVVRNNQETLGSCCITLLILALIVLLVLVIVL